MQQAVLRRVRILIFVDEDMAKFVLPFLPRFGIILQERDRQADQVIEIDRLIRMQRVGVLDVNTRGHRRFFVLGVIQCLLRTDQPVFPQRNGRLQPA